MLTLRDTTSLDSGDTILPRKVNCLCFFKVSLLFLLLYFKRLCDACVSVSMFVHVCVQVHMHVCLCVGFCACVCKYTCMCVHECVQVHIHV